MSYIAKLIALMSTAFILPSAAGAQTVKSDSITHFHKIDIKVLP